MTDIDTILEGAGERWRAAQPAPPAIDPAVFVDRGRWSRRPWSLVAAAAGLAAVVIVGAVALGEAQLGPGPTPVPGVGGRAGCAVTRPGAAFVPPSPFLAEPPENYGGAWFGTPALWVLLRSDGETWRHNPYHPPAPVSQKTFWWSAAWKPDDEPQPAITVTGTQLDGDRSFVTGDPGTNASADFGTAMLVGVEVPADGCWRITGEYRGATLSYVVWVGPE